MLSLEYVFATVVYLLLLLLLLRPLTEEMKAYGRSDTHYLPYIYQCMQNQILARDDQYVVLLLAAVGCYCATSGTAATVRAAAAGQAETVAIDASSCHENGNSILSGSIVFVFLELNNLLLLSLPLPLRMPPQNGDV